MRVSRGLNASNVVEIVTRLVSLFLHSGEGKKCFHCSAKIILRNCWRLLGDTEQILADDSFHPPNLPTGKRRWPRASDRAATAAAMIITRWAGLRGRRRLSRLKCGQSISAKLQGQSRWSSRSTTRGKRRAPGHDHLAGQHGTRRYLKSVVGLRVALDMRAQLGDRAEPDRPVR